MKIIYEPRGPAAEYAPLAATDLSGEGMEELQSLLDDLLDQAAVDEQEAAKDGGEDEGETASRKRGERTALVIVGHLKFELPRKTFDRWLAAVEDKVGNDPDRVVAEIKRRLKL